MRSYPYGKFATGELGARDFDADTKRVGSQFYSRHFWLGRQYKEQIDSYQ
jgi:hypothetical protein